MEKTADNWNEWAAQKAATRNALVAMQEAIEAYRDRCGSAATIDVLADELYAIGDGTEMETMTQIVKQLWELAAEMKT